MINEIKNLIIKGLADADARVLAGIKANQTRQEAIQNKAIEEIAKLNEGVVPTVSSAGLHAPVEGYIGLNEELYLKGQFIPITCSMDDYQRETKTFRFVFRLVIRLPLELESFLKELLESLTENEFNLDHGMGWVDNGLEVTNFYIEANSAYINTLKRINQSSISPLMRAHTLAGKGESPEGRQTVKGTVIKTDVKDNGYGFRSVMLVKLENNSTIWGSIPSKISDVKSGDVVEFCANFERASCGTHSFYKRPSKAQIEKKV